MAIPILKTLEDVANYCKALKNWFALCNKQLWSGTFGSGSITVPNTAKYQLFLIQEDSFKNHIGIKTPDGTSIEFFTWFMGSDKSNLYSDYGRCTVSGNKWTWVGVNQISHQPGSGHGSANSANRHITKIIGLLPTVPGYSVAPGRRWRYAASRRVPGGHRKICKHVDWKYGGENTGWCFADSVGKYIHDYSSWIKCGRQKNTVSYSVFRKSCSIWTMYVFDRLSRFIQHYSKHYFNKWILDGIQKQSCYEIYDSGCLDCNRQSVTPRGCCYA